MEFLTEEGKAEAYRIRDCLVNEVQGMEELPSEVMDYGSRTGLKSSSPEAQGLLSGEEEILVPYEGWYEEAQNSYANQHYHFRWSIEEGDPSLKALMPELFPPVKIKDGVLVKKMAGQSKTSPALTTASSTTSMRIFPCRLTKTARFACRR